MEACVLYGKGHWSELTSDQYEVLKEYMALVEAREERSVMIHNQMFGGK